MKRYGIIVVLLVIAALFVSCDQSGVVTGTGTGYVEIYISDTVAKTIQATSMDIATVSIVINEQSQDEAVLGNKVYERDNVAWTPYVNPYYANNNPEYSTRIELTLGKYVVTVFGYNSDGILVAKGTTAFELRQVNTITGVGVSLEELTDNGTFVINIENAEESEIWMYSIYPVQGNYETDSRQGQMTYNTELGKFTQSFSLAPGFYTVVVQQPANQPNAYGLDMNVGKEYREALRVISGQAVDLTIQSEGTSSKSLSLSMTDTRINYHPEVKFTVLNGAMKSEMGSPMPMADIQDGRIFCSADISFPETEHPNYINYEWYVRLEGSDIGIFPSYTNSYGSEGLWSTTMSFIPKGFGTYHVTLVIRADSWVWSESFEVLPLKSISVRACGTIGINEVSEMGPGDMDYSMLGDGGNVFQQWINSNEYSIIKIRAQEGNRITLQAYSLIPSDVIEADTFTWSVEALNLPEGEEPESDWYRIVTLSEDIIRLEILETPEHPENYAVWVRNSLGDCAYITFANNQQNYW